MRDSKTDHYSSLSKMSRFYTWQTHCPNAETFGESLTRQVIISSVEVTREDQYQ
ncbi:MAG: hypothetical protein KDC80_04670 [Saprospiraceae bacterium]|nr:hypothetical protein [Saprospiraceae bacterium]